MRSFLPCSIIIEYAAIIAIVSTIKGTSEQIKENLVSSGNNIVNVKIVWVNGPIHPVILLHRICNGHR